MAPPTSALPKPSSPFGMGLVPRGLAASRFGMQLGQTKDQSTDYLYPANGAEIRKPLRKESGTTQGPSNEHGSIATPTADGRFSRNKPTSQLGLGHA